jgi:hypothetical protein
MSATSREAQQSHRSEAIRGNDYDITVSGKKGLLFRGSYMVVSAGGSTTSKSVLGVVPATYTASGSLVSASFQKQSERGELEVTITKNGMRQQQESTLAPYGVVTIASR